MGWWANTTYINTDDCSQVAKVMTELFAEEGMRHIPRPGRPLFEPYPVMQYGTGLENNLWGVAVFPGSSGWTIIKTAPLDLLAERAPGASRMRLVDLCKRLATPGFQFNVYDSSDAVLAEVDAEGRLAISGFKER